MAGLSPAPTSPRTPKSPKLGVPHSPSVNATAGLSAALHTAHSAPHRAPPSAQAKSTCTQRSSA
eukprot:351219-Chlamydomonas_euryale.AAC.7